MKKSLMTCCLLFLVSASGESTRKGSFKEEVEKMNFKSMTLVLENSKKIEFEIIPINHLSIEALSKKAKSGRQLFDISKIKHGFEIYVGDWGESKGEYPPFKKSVATPTYVRIEVLPTAIVDEKSIREFVKKKLGPFVAEATDVTIAKNPKGVLLGTIGFYPSGGDVYVAFLILGKNPVLIEPSSWIKYESIAVH